MASGPGDGQVRYKNFWEVGPKWAHLVRHAFTGSSVTKLMKDEDDMLVVVEPLEPPLGRFGVIVVSGSLGPFQNHALIGTAAVASIVAPAPYAITGFLSFSFFWIQCVRTMRSKEADAKISGKRNSISATIVHPRAGMKI